MPLETGRYAFSDENLGYLRGERKPVVRASRPVVPAVFRPGETPGTTFRNGEGWGEGEFSRKFAVRARFCALLLAFLEWLRIFHGGVFLCAVEVAST